MIAPVSSDGLRLASIKDIAAFKLDAITMRKAKKDFYDLYFLLKKLSLSEMINAYQKKYPYNKLKNVMVALSSCAAADSDAQPELIEPVAWDKIKTTLINEIQQFEKNIILQKEKQMKEQE